MPFLFDFSDPVALETFLSALHIVAIFTVIVFQSSQASLCRHEWMNAATVYRLGFLDKMFWTVFILTIMTGILRLYLGAKGIEWYVSRPLFHAKMTMIAVMFILSIVISLKLRQWRQRLIKSNNSMTELPRLDEILPLRRKIMFSAHVLPVAGVLAVYWASGW